MYLSIDFLLVALIRVFNLISESIKKTAKSRLKSIQKSSKIGPKSSKMAPKFDLKI